MNLQELIDELNSLPQSARTATVRIAYDVGDGDVDTIRYTQGEVVIKVADEDDEDNDD